VSATGARVRSVNVVHALVPDLRGDLDRTAIDKRAVSRRVRVRPATDGGVGLDGDRVVDVRHHGGADQAVYAYAVEDLRWWAGALGRELPPGTFGENLTTEELDVSGALIGERWQVGGTGVVLEVTYPRIPCATFQGRMGEPAWVRRFTERGAPGAYLRVVAEGDVGAGDHVEVVHRPDHGVTVADTLVVRRAARDGLVRLLEMPGLSPKLEALVRRDLEARAR
jgi:MOSC domain-containing protein YiiM